MLVHSPTDHCSVEQRLTWLKPLLLLEAPLRVYADATYLPLVEALPKGPQVRILPLDLSEFSIVQQIQAAGHLQLPPLRTPAKDTAEFMTIMNAKSELLAAAAAAVDTPYIAYIDAGISKILKDPNSLTSLNSLTVRDIPLLLIPGCWPVRPVQPAFPTLWRQIHWILCGGFFIVPTEKAATWATLHATALQRFLSLGCITWEVNVWAALVPALGDQVIWFAADHNDSMLTAIPDANKIQSGAEA